MNSDEPVAPDEPTTTEVLAPDDFTSGVQAKPVESSAHLRELVKPFVQSLEEGDKDRGTSMAAQFKRYLEVYDSNAEMRANLKQFQFMLQQKLGEWANVQTIVHEMVENLNPNGRSFDERLDKLITLDNHFQKTCREVSRTVREIKEEIRKTEFGDETHIHIAVFQLAWNGIKGAINRRLHGRPEMQLLLEDMRALSKSVGIFRRAGG